ncbi:unnamed protein product [Paramecium primaurelia]|uniref:Cyclic nucleotide-binding domain-containing protein n=1 Tax=Paramecium primaurelia TaxID=5886 RepID=A0A8S1N926_PARPR|nr:unnamed protein product [Paramecium primaurelia]
MEDQFSEDYHLSLQQASARLSDRFQDKFKPQSIFLDQNPVPNKYTDTSQLQLWESNSDNQLKESQQQPSINGINVRNSLVLQNRTMTHIPTIKRIKQIINRNKLLLDVKDKLMRIGYIYPKNEKTNLINFLKETYLGESNQDQMRKQIFFEPIKIKLPTFSPTSKFILIWQIFRIIQIMFLLWWVPFKIAFAPQSSTDMINIEQALIYFMIFDLIIKLNVGIIDQGQIMKDRLFILLYYIKYELYEDVIYLITLIIIIREQPIDTYLIKEIIVLTQFLLNFIKLKKKIKTYEETLTTQSTLIELANLSQLIIVIFYFAHFMACVWYYVGIKSLDQFNESWIIKYKLIDAPISFCYGYSFYWATATMVTVGYGDVTGQNIYEVLCSIILMFLASGIFAFSINSIGQIFSNIDTQQQVYKRTLLLINHYMQFNEVQISLQSRIRNYIKYFFEQENTGNKNEIDMVLNQLSNNLRQELLQDVQLRVLKQSDFFRKNFSQATIRLIADHVKFQQCTPKELIYKQQNNDDKSVYIIQKGEIQLIDDNSGKILKSFTKGQSFGELEFLSFQARFCSAYSVTFSQLYKISREDFLNLIKDNAIDYQKFQQMKDQIQLKYQNEQFKCYACNQSHLIWDCHFLFYKPNIEALIKKSLFHTEQQRQNFKRSDKRYLNILHKSLDNEDSQEQTQKIVSIPSETSSEDSLQDNTKNQLDIEQEKQRDSIYKQGQQYQQRNVLPQHKQGQIAIEDINFNLNKRQSNRLSIRLADNDLPITLKRKSLQSIFPYDVKNSASSSQLAPIKEDIRKENKEQNYHLKSFHQLDELIDNKQYDDETDSVFSFQYYFPLNNVDTVLQEYQRFQKQFRQKKIKVIKSKYMFHKITKINKHKQNKHKKDQASVNSLVIRENI